MCPVHLRQRAMALVQCVHVLLSVVSLLLRAAGVG
jgi:hypothetical protein